MKRNSIRKNNSNLNVPELKKGKSSRDKSHDPTIKLNKSEPNLEGTSKNSDEHKSDNG